MSGPWKRNPKLEGDIVDTHAWIVMQDGRIAVCVAKHELPRSAAGWGEMGLGWRITLPTGEQGIVTDHYEKWGGVVAEIDVGDGLPLMRKRMQRQKKATAPRVRVRIERLDENVVVMPVSEVAS